MSKFKLRKKIISIRKKRYFEVRIGKNIIDNLSKQIDLSKNKIIGGYFPINFEFDCLQILKKFYSKGYVLSLPIIKRNHQMDFYNWSPNDPLTISSFGIPQPLKLKKVHPDIIFVPIVAFDKYNNRIGYGGGFYDRYLEKISKIKKCMAIGLAFSHQKVDKINVENFDRKLNLILTEKLMLK
ncbi:5-formyltetrahydrofolate cyclo-ligase [bacterium]|nr:5-formyltetrahydrofolate cyclo-ligase [bacterium]